MIYRLNTEPILKNANMTLPVSVAEDCLGAHTVGQIKTMLWLYQKPVGSPVSEEILAEELGLSTDEVADALDYWVGKGLIFEGSGKPTAQPMRTEIKQIQPVAKAVPDEEPTVSEKAEPTASSALDNIGTRKRVETITVNPPTQTELVKRCKESNEIRELMSTTEERINSTLSFSMQSTLLMLHDDYGLPVEVIALAVEYAAGRKKVSSRYIANIGRLWCENEIDTIEKAMEYIENANSVERSWSEFRDITGAVNPSPTKKQRDFLELWTKKMRFSMEMIGLAYEEMAERTGKFSFSYMNKILVNWQKNGIFTPADLQKAKQDRFEKTQKAKPAQSKNGKPEEKSDASYDLDAYTKKAFANPLNILKP